MIDFHNHVLPNIDDGSKSLDMSLEMMHYAAGQGITDVVNTVHYQHPKVETKNISYQRIQNELKNFQLELDSNNISVKLHAGAEVFFLPNLCEISGDPLATFINGKYMLIEFQAHHLPETQKKQLFDLKMSGITPIIAHPERYKFVQNNLSIITDWLEAGCLIQIDAGSPLGLLGSSSKTISERIIKNGWCHILGSDSHDDKKRNFCLAKSLKTIKSWIGDDALKMVYDHPKAVINGEKILIDFEYESKNTFNFLAKLKHKIKIN